MSMDVVSTLAGRCRLVVFYFWQTLVIILPIYSPNMHTILCNRLYIADITHNNNIIYSPNIHTILYNRLYVADITHNMSCMIKINANAGRNICSRQTPIERIRSNKQQ